MPPAVLYCGDTSLTDAAAYLAGLVHAWGWPLDYVPSDQAIRAEFLERPHRLFVLSDYPHAQFDPALEQRLLAHVAAGAGLVMIGGWESFHGCGGDWDGSLVAEALPVVIDPTDDRVNCDQPVLVYPACRHPIVDGLPWDARPPVIGGYNRFTPKAGGEVILESHRYAACRVEGGFHFEPAGRAPLLVVGRYGQGRTAALATDVAPHWVGPWVDWGTPRLAAQAPGASAIEVGGHYAEFLRRLLQWAAGA
jgi:hypothetical protein